jgi:hypothetical protein
MVLQSYFDGISAFDYQKMRDACSPDYRLFEDVYNLTVEDHIKLPPTMRERETYLTVFKMPGKH